MTFILDHVSPSQLNTWRRCQRQWKFRYIDKLIIPTAAQLALGGSYHKALETNYRPKVESGEDMPVDEVVDAFADAFTEKTKNEEVDCGDEKPGDVKDRGAVMTEAHMTERAPHIQPDAVEEKLTLPLTDDVEMVGIIDLRCNGGVSDHKTGKRAKRQEDLDSDSQATGYMVLVPDALSFSWEAVSATKKGVNCQTLTTKRNEEEKKFYLENVYATVAQMNFAIKSGYFAANTEGWHCSEKFCGWYGVCKPKGSR